MWVLNIASFYTPEASFGLYLAACDTAEDEDETKIRIPQLALARAVDEAIEHDIDVLNISAGRSRPNCTHGNCAYCLEVNRAVDHGISVVASAGNQEDDAVHCPSNTEPAISVGGMEVECTFNPPRIPETCTGKPPLAYWAHLFDGTDYPDGAATETYCSTRGCWQNTGRCERHKLRTSWDQNPIFSGGKPDLLAPVHYAGEQEDGRPFVWAAPSFAAPWFRGVSPEFCPGLIRSQCRFVSARRSKKEANPSARSGSMASMRRARTKSCPNDRIGLALGTLYRKLIVTSTPA